MSTVNYRWQSRPEVSAFGNRLMRSRKARAQRAFMTCAAWIHQSLCRIERALGWHERYVDGVGLLRTPLSRLRWKIAALSRLYEKESQW